MLNVNFFNVGQGDTISIDWDEDSVQQFVIIDCKQVQERVHPLYSYISKFASVNVRYIIMSHPHTDHFSGFLNLFSFLKNRNINIEYFLHTCQQVPEFIKASVKGISSERKATDLFIKLRELVHTENLKVCVIDGDSPNRKVSLFKNRYLEFLSPTIKEFDNYVSKTYLVNEEEAGNNPNANWLSTILLISNDTEYGLLTSDSETYSLKRVDKSFLSKKGGQMLFGQVPHHGAKKNHNNTFWRKRKNGENDNVVISVGANSYGHPSPEVVNFFNKNRFRIHSTNLLTDTSKKSRSLSRDFNLISSKKNVPSSLLFQL